MCRSQRVDESGFNCTGIECKTETHDHRNNGKSNETTAHCPDADICKRRYKENPDTQKEGRPTPARVRKNAGWDFENKDTQRKCRISHKDFEYIETRVQQKQRVYTPDQRGSKGIESGNREVAEKDLA